MEAVATVTDVAPRRVRMTRAQRREHFLDTAAELVVDSGLDSVTMERVAARAGVSKALGYAYFDNSDELLAALFDREMASYDRAITDAVAHARTFEDKIRAVVMAMFEMLAERGRLFGLLLNGAGQAGSSLAGRRSVRKDTSEAYIARIVAEEYGLSHKVSLSVAAIWIHATHGAIDSWVAGRGNRRELTDLFVALTTGGLDRLAGTLGPRTT